MDKERLTSKLLKSSLLTNRTIILFRANITSVKKGTWRMTSDNIDGIIWVAELDYIEIRGNCVEVRGNCLEVRGNLRGFKYDVQIFWFF